MGNVRQTMKNNIEKNKTDFLTRFVGKVPNYLNSKNNISFINHLNNIISLINQDAVYRVDDNRAITILLTKKVRPFRNIGISEEISIINEYKISIEEDKVIFDRKENTITTNENYISNGTNYTKEVYSNSSEGVVRDVFISSRSNSFPNTRNVIDRCIVKELMLSHKYIYSENFDIKHESIIFGKEKEYEVDKTTNKFKIFASEPKDVIIPYSETVYNNISSRVTTENYIISISGKNNNKKILLYKTPLQKETYSISLSNVEGRNLTLDEFKSLISNPTIDPSSLIEDPQIK